jgi:hypothetical protein
MLKLRGRVMLETSIRDFDAPFGYAEGFDQTTRCVRRLDLSEGRPEILSPQRLLVRADIAKQQVPRPIAPVRSGPRKGRLRGPAAPAPGAPGPSPTPPTPIKPRPFYGSFEIVRRYQVATGNPGAKTRRASPSL